MHCPQPGLHHTGHRRREAVGRDRRRDDEVKLLRTAARVGERLACGLFRKRSRALALRNTTFPDAGALYDPFIIGVNKCLKLAVCQHLRG